MPSQPTPPAAVDIRGLRVVRAGRAIVDDVDLLAPRGQVTVVLGPNGAGKTTTIEVAEGFGRADAGRVRVLGRDPVADAAALRPRVGVMLQSGGIWPATSPRRLLTHLARLYTHPHAVEGLLDALDLGAVARTPYRRLSGGEAHKLELAAAIIGRPELVFLDEPTTGLDPHSRLRIWDLVSQLRAAGTSVVMTTHLLDEAEHLADRITILAGGRVVVAGTPEELAREAASGALIRFRAPVGLPIGDLEMRLPAACRAREATPGHYEVTGPVTPATVADVTAWCAGLGVLPTELSTRASLADTYFQLVGPEAAREDPQELTGGHP